MVASDGSPRDSGPRGASGGSDVVYGRNPVKEALRGRRRVHRILVRRGGRKILDEMAGTELAGVEVEEVQDDRLESAAGSTDHQGTVALVDPYSHEPAAELLASHSLILVLDRIQDPHNLGAIVRTADAVGAAVVLPRHRSADVTPAAVKASAGATEHVPIARARNLTDFVEEAKEAGYWTYGAAVDAEKQYDQEEYPKKVVLCLGSEGEGLGRRLADACDVLVSIPLKGNVESLNVSVAAAVVAFEVRRQWSGTAAG